jgi:signal transduction histidine kinase/DNA-binding response OmpR family regulator
VYKAVRFLLAIIIALAVPVAPAAAGIDSVALTPDETAFIADHAVIRLGIDPEFVPFEFIDEDGDYAGIAADYLALVSRKTGLEFEVARDLTWPEAYERVRTGDLDALPAIGLTQERGALFSFSQPYYSFKRVIVTREEDTGINGITDLEGQIIAVQRNSSHHSYLMDYPKINLGLYDSVDAALAAVAAGTEKAFIGNLATTNYLIRTQGLSNLRLVAFEADKQQDLHFAARKDWPELISIFNKALDAITRSEKQAINKRWIELDTSFDYGPLVRAVVIISAASAIAFMVSFFWIAKLRREIGRRKQIQADLEEAKRQADEASGFKSSFMARMSHEIRTPLNAISGMAYLLKKTELSLTQKMYADRITQASANMLSIINDILDYSKIEAGKAELEITSFSMDRVIEDVINIVSYKVEEQGIGLRLSKDPQIPNWFMGDPRRLEQVLLNVLNNAAKFTGKGEVSLDIRLTAKENGKYHLAFSVKDTGIGMHADQVNNLFQPFVQGDSSINRRFGGSGLGLSIVKNIVEMMGGHIQVFSTPGEGTTFVIHLSFEMDAKKESEHIGTLSGDPFKHVKTLVLEKTGANINLIDSYLSALGMSCELTTSEKSAMSMLEAAGGKFAKAFDLFILDYETPAEGGFRYVEAVRRNDRIQKKPQFIMLFPMMREDLFDKLKEYGIRVGIGKPIIPSVLFNGILELFEMKAVGGALPSQSDEITPVDSGMSRSVLVAEDNSTNQLIAKSLLQQINVDAIMASDGKEAVDLFRRSHEDIALVLMDLHMPVMNGYEAAEKIREIEPDMPIVAMTADIILGVKEKCAKSGMDYYISKPFDPDVFLRTIKDILAQRQDHPMTQGQVLDKAAGLKFMGGNAEIYGQVLREYYAENLDTPKKLDLAIREERFADAAQIAHKIKSSSGSIGARALFDLSVSLQKALDEGKANEIAPLKEQFTQVLEQLLGEISGVTF